jgi:hypothetical protein
LDGFGKPVSAGFGIRQPIQGLDGLPPIIPEELEALPLLLPLVLLLLLLVFSGGF